MWPQGPASHGTQQPQSAHPKVGIRQGGRAGAETDLIHLNGLSELQHLQQSSTQLLIFETLLIFLVLNQLKSWGLFFASNLCTTFTTCNSLVSAVYEKQLEAAAKALTTATRFLERMNQ